MQKCTPFCHFIAILDNYGNTVVQYTYDAWGNHTVTGSNPTLGNINPFRYRGYYYDTETGLYYLQTRYYDPEVGRFLNMDSLDYADPETINGLNLYAYCNNNPVMYVDPTGESFLVFLVAAVIGFTVSFVTSAATQAVFNEGQVNWSVAAIDGLFGAISGALWMVPGLGPISTGLINAGLTVANGIITTGMENDWQFTLIDAITIASSAATSGICSGIMRNRFFKAGGREILKESHKLVGTIGKRILNGAYNNGKEIFSKSFRSAAGQIFKNLAELNFGKGFYKEWILTGLQAICTAALLRGLKSIK